MDPAESGKSEVFEVRLDDSGTVVMTGRCHAGHAGEVRDVLDRVSGPVQVDFANLEYISSAGLGVLLAAQKRLRGAGHGLTLINLNAHIREVFRIAGFDKVFEIN